MTTAALPARWRRARQGGPRCAYLSAYDRRILLIWPRSLTSLATDGSVIYVGGTIRNGARVILRGPLHFDQSRAEWPSDAREGCDYSHFMYVAPGRARP